MPETQPVWQARRSGFPNEQAKIVRIIKVAGVLPLASPKYPQGDPEIFHYARCTHHQLPQEILSELHWPKRRDEYLTDVFDECEPYSWIEY